MNWIVEQQLELSQSRCLILHPHVTKKSYAFNNHNSLREPESCLQETVGLANSIGLVVAYNEIVNLNNLKPSTLIGGGVINRVAEIIKRRDINIAIVDYSLTPIQQRNLEKKLNSKVIDRTGLILEIFGARARTKEGRLQVDLAYLIYQRSRLVRSWTHLERQRGGFGFMGGPGERQIEADRRMIGNRIIKIQNQLIGVQRTRSLHRKSRNKVPYPVIALVGYTNAGKSTLFNALTSSTVIAEDKLFATLDPTMRGLTLPSGKKIILSDTVGFISALPHELVEAFKSTLEEVMEANLIIHVRDIANENTEAEKQDVLEVLNELVSDKNLGNSDFSMTPVIEVLNKSDLLTIKEKSSRLLRTQQNNSKMVLVSSTKKEGFTDLLEEIDIQVNKKRKVVKLEIDWDQGSFLNWLYKVGEIIYRRDTNKNIQLKISLDEKDLNKIKKINLE
ncbi:MAG: GTPase HflX [Rhodospirillales bacterium]|nr:MAG: GTPase HflX [Rhodospirillaceae bacterium TMED23]